MITLDRTAPNQTAKRLTGRDYISFSAISTYQSCPLRYYFKYVAGLPEPTVSASLVFGGAIHRAVELHFNRLMAGETPPDLDMLLAEYQEAWREHDGAKVVFGKDDNRDTLGRLAERMLRAFQASDLARPEGTIIGVEEELRGMVIPGCPNVLARIDLLIETPTHLILRDLKTSRSRWTRGQADDSAEQLLLYSELAGRLMPDKPVRLEFAVISKTKEPAVDRISVTSDPARVRRTKRVVQRVWRAIAAGNFYPSPSPINCPSCPYRGPCRAWQG